MTRIALRIPIDHPAFAGHFPMRPIVPGVVLLDESLRAIDADAMISSANRCALSTWRIASAKFLSFVLPGEAVHLEYECTSSGGAYRLRVLAGDAPDERLAVTCSASMVMSEDGQSGSIE